MATNETKDMLNDFIPQELAIKAMRDSGYKNTAYALAELIDNAVQAKARAIEIFCVEQMVAVRGQNRRRIETMAVLDDGHGMDPQTLGLALQFGNGTHLQDRSGIGRFGMGLPNASISQCRRVTVWTWQTGIDNAYHTYLDVDEIEKGTLRYVPALVYEPLPKEWRERADHLGTSGTLVIWENFDQYRLTWKTGRATLNHLEDISGRIYRKFISQESLGLRFTIIEAGREPERWDGLPNDPLYLMAPTHTPDPFGDSPMFSKHPETVDIEPFIIEWQGKQHEIVIRASVAKQQTVEARGNFQNRGDTAYGRNARDNIGVSIMRENRELDLDISWTNRYDTVDRWWGIEIEFPADLDEVFGVSNNKQSATIFSSMSQYDWREEAEEDENYRAFIRRLQEDGEPRGFLLPIVLFIRDRLIVELRRILDGQVKGIRGGTRHKDGAETTADIATKVINTRIGDGKTSPQDDVPFDEKAEDELGKILINKNYPEGEAKRIAREVRVRGRRMEFFESYEDTQAFFTIGDQIGNVTQVFINQDHAAFSRIFLALDKDTEDSTNGELVERIENAAESLKLLIGSFARYEIEDIPNSKEIAEMRYEWGKMAADFLKSD